MTDIRIIRLGMDNDGTATAAQGGGAGLTNAMIEAKTTAGNVALSEYTISYSSTIGICADYSGNIYGADDVHNRIVKITEGGVVSYVAGDADKGAAGNNGTTTVPAFLARFNAPAGIACDKFGTLYIADSHNHQIRTYRNGMVGVLAGSAGVAGFSDGAARFHSDPTQGHSALFNHPDDVCVDKAGVVYVADRGNNAIRKITPDGKVTTIAGITATGAAGNGHNIQPCNFTACLNYPTAITVDAMGNLFISDLNNNEIKKLTPDGWLRRYSGSGNVGKSLGATSDGTVNTVAAYTCSYVGVYDLAADNSGNVYALDKSSTTRSRLIKIDRDGKPAVIADWDSNSYGGASNTGPYSIAMSPAQILFVLNYATEESSSSSSESLSSNP